MESKQPNFKNSNIGFEKEEKGKPLTREGRMNLIKKYLTPEGKGNELFAECCLRYLVPVVTGILGNTDYREEIDDAVQVATINATFRLKQFNGESSLQTWLFSIGTHQAMDRLRRTKTHKDILRGIAFNDLIKMGEDINELADVQNGFENAELLQHVLSTLNEHQKHILILFHVEGYSIKEISEMLDIKEVTIRGQLFRARKKAADYAEKKGWTR